VIAVASTIQITVDAANPPALGAFWAHVLGYIEQPPPPGFDTWDDALDAMGIDRSDPEAAFALVDPDGVGPRLFFLKVPEAKTAKNRFHLDVSVPVDQQEARAAELVALLTSRVSVAPSKTAFGMTFAPSQVSPANDDRHTGRPGTAIG
jgi:hypothetical protein